MIVFSYGFLFAVFSFLFFVENFEFLEACTTSVRVKDCYYKMFFRIFHSMKNKQLKLRPQNLQLEADNLKC